MKVARYILALISIAVFIVSALVIQVAVHERADIPDYFSRADTRLTFNEWANKNIDPHISNAEYDAIRHQYFEDRIAPRIEPIYRDRAWEEFKTATQRSNTPGRDKTLSDYLPALRWAMLIAAVSLLIQALIWIWLRVLKPAKEVIIEGGINDLIRVMVFGRKGLMPYEKRKDES